ncbi:MAG: transglycosylase domain-containing protein, partial [Acidobacteria bacterium]|nr:transglycosylase domain-containing protein [Acidobacteriota bacterium]
YFRQPAARLTLAQAALLAALPKAPSHYDPRCHPDRALARRNLVLARMAAQGRVAPRIVVAGRLGQGGEQRRLRQGQPRGRLAEVLPGRRLDAARAVAEVDVIEVQLQDLSLGEVRLELLRDADLEQLPGRGALLAGDLLREEIAGQLHGDRAEALLDAAGTQVGGESASDAVPVDGAVPEEAPVLDRHEGVGEVRRQRGQAHLRQVVRSQRGDHLPLAVQQQRRSTRTVGGKPGGVGAAMEAAGLPGRAARQGERADGRERHQQGDAQPAPLCHRAPQLPPAAARSLPGGTRQDPGPQPGRAPSFAERLPFHAPDGKQARCHAAAALRHPALRPRAAAIARALGARYTLCRSAPRK